MARVENLELIISHLHFGFPYLHPRPAQGHFSCLNRLNYVTIREDDVLGIGQTRCPERVFFVGTGGAIK